MIDMKHIVLYVTFYMIAEPRLTHTRELHLEAISPAHIAIKTLRN
jgi:hypothetical protein